MNNNRKIMFSMIGIAIVIIILVGVTYAFFNYTKTGSANNIRTGSMNFNAEQGTEVTLSDLFPISVSGEITPETPGVGSVTVHVTGDTNYSKGIEYRVKAVNVTGANGANLPISVNISYTANGNGNTIGTSDDNYYVNRGGSSSVYKVLSTDTITDGGDLVVGYIAPGATGIDGNIVVMAYLDAENIAITDTYNDPPATPNDNMGTESEWVDGRTVFTTQEWNALSSSGVSFQIEVEANEGLWVPGSMSGTATIEATSENSADIYVISGNILFSTGASEETSAETGDTKMVIDEGTLCRYNFTTSTCDEDITNSGLFDEVTVTFQHNSCLNGEPVTVTNHASDYFIDGTESLDPEFVTCLIGATAFGP